MSLSRWSSWSPGDGVNLVSDEQVTTLRHGQKDLQMVMEVELVPLPSLFAEKAYLHDDPSCSAVLAAGSCARCGKWFYVVQYIDFFEKYKMFPEMGRTIKLDKSTK